MMRKLSPFFDITCWRNLAENVAESITKGSRVVVYGRLDQRSWETQDGDPALQGGDRCRRRRAKFEVGDSRDHP